jgi:hypothetical protein
MARVLRWLAVCAFLAAPLALVLGRSHGVGDPPQPEWPGWTFPAFVGAVALGMVLLVVAEIVRLGNPD